MKKIFFTLLSLAILFPFQTAHAQMPSAKSPYPYIDYLGESAQTCNRVRYNFGEKAFGVCKQSAVIQKNAMVEKNINGCNELKTLLDQTYDFGKTYHPTDKEIYTSYVETLLQQCRNIVRNAIETGHTSIVPPPLNLERYTFLIQLLCLLMGMIYLIVYLRKQNNSYFVGRLLLQYIFFALLTSTLSSFFAVSVSIPVHPLYDLIFVKPAFYTRIFSTALIYSILVISLSYVVFQRLFTDENRKKELFFFLLTVHPLLFPLNFIIAGVHLIKLERKVSKT